MLIFTKESISNGWSMFWRMLPVMLLYALIDSRLGKAQEASMGDFLIKIIFIVIAIIAYNIIGKSVARKKYNLGISDFIGWGIMWRAALMNIACDLALAPFLLLFVVLIVVVKKYLLIWPALIIVFSLALLLTLAYLFAFILALGWAATKVIKHEAQKEPIV